MADAYMGWNVEYAKRMLRILTPFNMRWVEEPVISDDLRGYAELQGAQPRQHLGRRARIHDPRLPRRASRSRPFDIAQPDVNRVGGITAAKKIADLCEANDIIFDSARRADAQLSRRRCRATHAPISGILPAGARWKWATSSSGTSSMASPIAKDGFIDLADDKAGFGLTLKPRQELQADPLMPYLPHHRYAPACLGPDAAQIFGVRRRIRCSAIRTMSRTTSGTAATLEIEAMVFLECYADFREGRRSVHRGDRVRRRRAEARPAHQAPSSPWRRSNGASASSRCSTRCGTSIRACAASAASWSSTRTRARSRCASGFIEGVNLLEKFGWAFDINPNYTQMDIIREWVSIYASATRAADPEPLR